MEYVRGRTLTAWLEEAAALPERRRIQAVLRRFLDAGRGLAAVHQAGLMHRDFKPDNVLVGEDGRVRVLDFGLARTPAREPEAVESAAPALPVAESDGLLATLTATGQVLGTPRFIAPEQWRGRGADARSDQFSFCVALFEALWGQAPFRATTVRALARAVVAGELRMPPRKPEIAALVDKGRDLEADEAFESFAGLPEHAGTHAIARGWLGQAERLRLRDAREAELAALASAYVESPGPEQEDALLGLIRAFARTRNYAQLTSTLEISSSVTQAPPTMGRLSSTRTRSRAFAR